MGETLLAIPVFKRRLQQTGVISSLRHVDKKSEKLYVYKMLLQELTTSIFDPVVLMRSSL
jgi:hypothetical protein